MVKRKLLDMINDLAVLISGTDRFSFLWNAWYWYFKKNWNMDLCDIYFLNEKKDIDFPGIKQIKVEIFDVFLWTKFIREALKEIPQNNIYILQGDAFLVEGFKKNEFERIFNAFKIINADALRTRDITIRNTVYPTKFFVNGVNLKKFANESQYLISNGFNIIKKSFFLKCLQVDESPWDNEVKGTSRIRNSHPDIYVYEKPTWYVDVCKKGAIIPEGQKLINEFNESQRNNNSYKR